MTIKPLSYGRDITNFHLDELRSRAYEGVATFPAKVCRKDKGYPLEGEAGILTIYSDEKDLIVFQQITFFTLRTYFRSGKYDKVSGLFIWKDWSYYLTIHDLQKDNQSFDLDDVYMTQEDYNTESNIPGERLFEYHTTNGVKNIFHNTGNNLDNFTPKLGFEMFTYKYEGELKDTDDLFNLKSLETLTGESTNIIVGYYDRPYDIPDEVDLKSINTPTRKSGILEIYTQLYGNFSDTNSYVNVKKVLIYTEYTTGDIYVTATDGNVNNDFSRMMGRNNVIWHKYSCDASLTQSLNKKVIDFFRKEGNEKSFKLPWLNPLYKDDVLSVRGYRGNNNIVYDTEKWENTSMYHSGLLSWEVIPQYANTWISKGNTLEITAPENGWIAALVPAGAGYVKYTDVNDYRYLEFSELMEKDKELIRDYSFNTLMIENNPNMRKLVATIMNTFGWYYSNGKLVPTTHIRGGII